jgi:4-aminobutyrate aminotransferase-like enzyme
MGSRFSTVLIELKEEYSEKIVDIKGRGLMWGIEFVDEFTSLFFTLSMINYGVWCDYCGNYKVTNKFLPPLIIEAKGIDVILKKIEISLMEI